MIGVATNPNSDNMTSHLAITMMEDDSDIDTTIHSTSTDSTASLTMAMTMTGPAHETLSEEIITPTPVPAVSVAMTESKNVPTPTQEQQNVNMNTNMNTNVPDLVAIQSTTCDACPYCNDICLNFESCAACRQKIMDLNLTYHRFISRKNVNVGNGGTNNSGTRNRSGSKKNHNNTAEEVHVEELSCASWFRNTNAKTNTNTTAKTYISPCHLRRHNTRQSPWLKCGNDIYDATPFLRGHPGGEACILKKSGGAVDDCTRDMMFHSARAIALWKKYRVGTYRPCCRGNGNGGCGAGAGASASAEQNDFWNNRHVEDENEESCVIS